MEKKKKIRFIVGWLLITAALLAGSLLVPGHGKSESVQEAMRDAVLHGTNRISLFGLKDVNPAYISSLVVVGALLLAAILLRVFVIPRFKMVPGKLQMALETVVGLFDGMAKGNSPHRNKFLGAYISAPACTSSWERCLSCSASRPSPRVDTPSRCRPRCRT